VAVVITNCQFTHSSVPIRWCALFFLGHRVFGAARRQDPNAPSPTDSPFPPSSAGLHSGIGELLWESYRSCAARLWGAPVCTPPPPPCGVAPPRFPRTMDHGHTPLSSSWQVGTARSSREGFVADRSCHACFSQNSPHLPSSPAVLEAHPCDDQVPLAAPVRTLFIPQGGRFLTCQVPPTVASWRALPSPRPLRICRRHPASSRSRGSRGYRPSAPPGVRPPPPPPPPPSHCHRPLIRRPQRKGGGFLALDDVCLGIVRPADALVVS